MDSIDNVIAALSWCAVIGLPAAAVYGRWVKFRIRQHVLPPSSELPSQDNPVLLYSLVSNQNGKSSHDAPRPAEVAGELLHLAALGAVEVTHESRPEGAGVRKYYVEPITKDGIFVRLVDPRLADDDLGRAFITTLFGPDCTRGQRIELGDMLECDLQGHCYKGAMCFEPFNSGLRAAVYARFPAWKESRTWSIAIMVLSFILPVTVFICAVIFDPDALAIPFLFMLLVAPVAFFVGRNINRASPEDMALKERCVAFLNWAWRPQRAGETEKMSLRHWNNVLVMAAALGADERTLNDLGRHKLAGVGSNAGDEIDLRPLFRRDIPRANAFRRDDPGVSAVAAIVSLVGDYNEAFAALS